MRKVGIMSMQRIANYGTFLQAYALKQLIEERFMQSAVFRNVQTVLWIALRLKFWLISEMQKKSLPILSTAASSQLSRIGHLRH